MVQKHFGIIKVLNKLPIGWKINTKYYKNVILCNIALLLYSI